MTRTMTRWWIPGLLALLAGMPGSGAESSPEPIFQYRVLLDPLRNQPGNTAKRLAASLKTLVPDDIRPYAVPCLGLTAVGYNLKGGDTNLALCRRFDAQGCRFMVDIGDPKSVPESAATHRTVTVPEIREILAACRNCIGVSTGETLWAFVAGYGSADARLITGWHEEVLRACQERNRWFFLAEGTWNRGHWTGYLHHQFASLHDRGLGRILVAGHKNTKPWATYQNLSALSGAWLCGEIA